MPLTYPPGYEFLGSTRLAAAAASSAVLTIPAREMLIIEGQIPGYAGTDIIGFRFNGDTAANYFVKMASAAAAATAWTVTNPAAATRMQVSATAVTAGRVFTIKIQNVAASRKEAWIQCSTDPAAASAPIADSGFGLWSNTSAQITSVQAVTGGQNMDIGMGFAVWGISF